MLTEKYLKMVKTFRMQVSKLPMVLSPATHVDIDSLGKLRLRRKLSFGNVWSQWKNQAKIWILHWKGHVELQNIVCKSVAPADVTEALSFYMFL